MRSGMSKGRGVVLAAGAFITLERRGQARLLGRMLDAARRSGPIDAHIVLLARERGWPLLTSHPDDPIRRALEWI
jgi:hypothetical protein